MLSSFGFCNVCIFLIVITGYLEIAKGVNFIVEECPSRPVTHIRSQAELDYELSVIFYYAPWAQESLIAKEILNHVAHYYYDQIYFATVNCWHLECNCSRTHTTGTGLPHSYPTMMVYYGERIKLAYQGEWTFAALARFFNSLYKPVERVNNMKELKLLTAECNVVVLGLFANANSMEYRKFVAAAVRWLETDPEKSFRFAISLGTAAMSFFKQNVSAKLPQIILVDNKFIEVFNVSNSFRWETNQINIWLQTELKRALHRISSGYSTPSDLAIQLRIDRPGLVIFANDYNTSDTNFYTIVEKEMDTRSSKSATMSCKTLTWSNSNYDGDLLRAQREIYDNEISIFHKVSYKKEYLSLHNLQYYHILNNYLKNVFASFRPEESYGVNSAPKLLELYESNKCLRHMHHTQYKAPEKKFAMLKFLTKSIDQLRLNSSLSSSHNRTLFASILDANKYADLLTAQGIDNSPSSAATVLIVDPKKEHIIVMQEQFTYANLLNFIKNYYENNLYTTHKMSSRYNHLTVHSNMNSIYLHNLNRQMFLNVVQQQNLTSVVLLYSPGCAFSVIMSQVLLQISAMLVDVSNEIQFIRLNTQSNDLPWEFVMATTPTLIVFPKGRAVDSRIFPAHLKINVRNVFGFILAKLEPIDQVKIALSSCRSSMSTLHVQKCLHFAKTLIMQHIGQHLKFWQTFENERSFLLERLKQFKDFSLDIQRSFRL